MGTMGEKSIQSLIDALPYCIYIMDTNGDINYINSSALELCKLDYNGLENMNIYDIFKLNGIECNVNLFSQENNPIYSALNNGIETKNMIMEQIQSGKQKYLDLNVYPIYGNDKEINGAIVYMSDITKEYMKSMRIKKEREQFISISTELKTKCDIIEILRDREKQHLMHLKDVINNISEGLIVLDSNGKFSFCNKSVYSIIDAEAKDIIHYTNIIKKYEIDNSNGEADFVYNIYNEYFKNVFTVKSLVVKLTEKDTGSFKYIEFNSSPIISMKNQLLYTIITLKDVTDLKEHELYAEEQANFIKDVINTMDIPIAVLDYPDLNTRFANKKFETFINSLVHKDIKTSIVNRSLKSLLDNDNGRSLLEMIEFSGLIGREYNCSPYRIKDLHGEDRYYKIKFKPYQDRNGLMNRIHIHASDITEEINHNMELEKVTKLKDEFFTVISHELRTPLTIIYSSLQLAYDIYENEITANVDKTLRRINQNCSRLLKLINNILDISKAEAGFLTLNPINFDIVSVTEFIVTSVNSYAVSKGIDLIFDTNEEEMEVCLDKEKYEKILLNLLSNAIKFTPEGKTILVSLNIMEDSVCLMVKDEGIGIPEDKIESIFDRFAQVNSSLSRRAEGTGIGLSLVKKLVELMGGTIGVKSKVDLGSEFSITFNKKLIGTSFSSKHSMVNENMNDKINIEFSDVG